jgi:hypothetical protein
MKNGVSSPSVVTTVSPTLVAQPQPHAAPVVAAAAERTVVAAGAAS